MPRKSKTVNLFEVCQVGDVILTYSRLTWRDLWRRPWYAIKMFVVYRAIWRHQRDDYRYNRAIHCAVVVPPEVAAIGKLVEFVEGRSLSSRFFEVTTPAARFGGFEEYVGQQVTVCRPNQPIDAQTLLASCEKMKGTDYDEWDLVDFALAKLIFKRPYIKLLGEAKKWVCSNGVARGLVDGKYDFHRDDWPAIRPAYYENRPEMFTVLHRRRKCSKS